MTRSHITVAFAVACVLATTMHRPARADFRLQTGNQTSFPAAPVVASETGEEPAAEPVRPAARSRFNVAYGFGNEVPLSFAVRQIVPSTVTVRFGKTVDPSAIVSWKGDAPWNRVLAAAVRPLGLQITTSATSVLIDR